MTVNGSMVQLKGEADQAPHDPTREEKVHEIADQGVKGSGQQLPHLDKIQKAFGRHDVSDVKAHTDKDAEQANKGMGSQAYAKGKDVAFGGTPDLHTAAHEAAHTVQQKGGVKLKGGVGEKGDPLEKNADAVADAVVKGQSAEHLLDATTGKEKKGPAEQEGKEKPKAAEKPIGEIAKGGASGGAGGALSSPRDPASAGPVQHKDRDDAAVQHKADGAVQFENPPTTTPKDEPGAWSTQRDLTKDSFFDLIQMNLEATRAFESTAEIVDPPPAWQSLLATVGTVVLAAALGGVGGVLAGALIKEGMKYATQFAINAAIEGGKKAIEEGVGAVTKGAGTSGKAPLKAFCEAQRKGMIEASKRAREGFVESSGDFTNQKVSIADMKTIKANNDKAFDNAQAIMNREMLKGWMNMVAGKDSPASQELEDTSQSGTLGLVIGGSGDSPTKITAAQTEGINTDLRNQITGTKVKDWANTGGKKSGIDIVVRTGNPGAGNQFKASSATITKMVNAGVYPKNDFWNSTIASSNDAIYFAIGMTRDGQGYIDQDAYAVYDFGYGADGGRWFINNVKSTYDIINEMGNLEIPAVGT